MSGRCGCHSLWCWLDESLHALGVYVAWICDRHDRVITGEPRP